jgi:hypothetical protein
MALDDQTENSANKSDEELSKNAVNFANEQQPAGGKTVKQRKMAAAASQKSAWDTLKQRLASARITEALLSPKFFMNGKKFTALRTIGEGGYSTVFEAGLWIRIRIVSGFSDFVDPDPYWESRSGSRGKKMKIFQWENVLFSYRYVFSKILPLTVKGIK